MADNTFFDDQELLRLGMSQPTVDAIERAFTNSSGGGDVIIDLEEAEQITLEASASAQRALIEVTNLATRLANYPMPQDFTADMQILCQKINQVALLLAAQNDFSDRFYKVERRLSELEILAHGNNVHQ